jgi:hypothetical protein
MDTKIERIVDRVDRVECSERRAEIEVKRRKMFLYSAL